MPTAEDARQSRLVFIYGTLKQGYPNNRYMPESAKYAGTACTVVPWPLVIDTEMGIPYLLQVPDHPNAKIVQGELYRVDETAVKVLDDFEGLHTGFYIRKELNVLHPCLMQGSNSKPASSESVVNSPGTVITATAYFRSPANGGPAWARKWTVEKLLALPMVEEYSKEHTLGFVSRTDRKGS